MRASLRMIHLLFGLIVPSAQGGSPPHLTDLPPPIYDYAVDLKPYCEQIGRREVVVNHIYSDRLFGALDINTDGIRDYFVYKCMFGCDGEPYALQGLGPRCMFGSLLLSSGAEYRNVPVPGQLEDVRLAPRLRVAVYRAHVHAQDCHGQWYCKYVYELRENWFRLVGPCPPAGCRALLSAPTDDLAPQAAARP